MRFGSVPVDAAAVMAAPSLRNRGSLTSANATTTVAAANSRGVARLLEAPLVIASSSSVTKGQAMCHRRLRRQFALSPRPTPSRLGVGFFGRMARDFAARFY
jgi:hypothetical protein